MGVTQEWRKPTGRLHVSYGGAAVRHEEREAKRRSCSCHLVVAVNQQCGKKTPYLEKAKCLDASTVGCKAIACRRCQTSGAPNSMAQTMVCCCKWGVTVVNIGKLIACRKELQELYSKHITAFTWCKVPPLHPTWTDRDDVMMWF